MLEPLFGILTQWSQSESIDEAYDVVDEEVNKEIGSDSPEEAAFPEAEQSEEAKPAGEVNL